MSYDNYGATDMLWLPAARSKKGMLKKTVRVILFVLSAILVFLAAYFPFTYRWSQTTWSDLTIQEIIYHLTMPAEGTATGMVSQHIIKCLLPAAAITAGYVIFVMLIRKRKTAAAFVKGGAAAVSVIIISATIGAFWTEMDVTGYVDNQSTYSSFIDNNYVDPASVNLTFPEQKRNLIYIFLESTEATFADTSVGGAFESNVIPELTQLSLDNENFSGGSTELDGGVPMTGGTWTMGAMFGQTSGLPLTISMGNNDMSGQSEFFPEATTLGDILEEEGYNQTLLLGSDATFGGRKLYFTTHGNYAMRDYNYYTGNGTLPSDYYVWWGYEDMYLFENAKTELAELSAQDAPFNLTMLTVDTHFEDGYVCSLCQNETDDQYSNVYHCASRQVSEFIEWCKTQDWYDNTTIVLAGDHLTMDSDFCINVASDYQRKTYVSIINGAAERSDETYREYSTLDMFPTTLAAMGVEIPGDKLALGTNLYSSEETLLEVYGYDELNNGLSTKSQLMDNLTAGISSTLCTLNVLEPNYENNTVQIVVSDITAANGISSVYATVSGVESGTFEGEYRGDGSFILTIDISDTQSFPNGTYSVIIKGREEGTLNGVAYQIGAVSFDISRPADYSAEQTDAASINGVVIGDYDYANGSFNISYTSPNMSNLSGVQFAIWKNADQSDLKWVVASIGDNGAYSADVNAFDFTFDSGSFNIDTYEILLDGTANCVKHELYQIDG